MIKETHRKNMREYKIRRQLFNILSKNNPNNIKEYDISIPEYKKIKKIIEEIKEKEDFRQRDDLFSSDEKWYLICNEGGGKIDISLSYDKIKSIPCNVIFNNCNIDLCVIKPKDLEKDNTETIKNHLYFYNCTFENLLIKLKNIIFEKTLTFNQCAFYNDLDIHQNQFLDHLVFINCYDKRNDKKITSLDLQENEFEGYLFIKNCAIEKINLWKNKFKNRCYFVDSNFGYKDKDNTTKLNFSNTHFKDNVYFNNSEFYSYADFHECEFDDIACFYGVKFHKIPNFSACYFKEQKAANLINVDIDKLDFKSVEKYIEDNYQDETCENKQEITEEQRNNNCKLKCAKHLKDSFRVIKDVLITQNNTLEAQEWHKLELYAKERELLFEVESCYKEKNKPFIAAKSEDKNSINLTFSVLLLWIYRVTSLHHTNLPRIINFTSLNIVAFGCLVCLITYLSYHIDKQSNFWFRGVFILSVLVMAIVYLTLKKHKLKSIRLILFTFLAFLMALFLIQSITLLHLFSDVVFALFLYCLLVIALICLYPYINSISFVSYCFNWLVYFFFVMVVVIKPQLINPFAGIFSSDKLYESQFEKSLNDLNTSAIINLASILQNDFNLHLKDQNISFTELNSAKALIIANKENLLKLNDVNSNITKEVLGEKYTELLKTINQDEITENTIKSTSVLYSIILLLCIFSLQKTARKNSIVPS
ncbi:pentapeptide repeat-containing protein [Campylobacter coli]